MTFNNQSASSSFSTCQQPIGDEDGLVRPMRAQDLALAEAAPVEVEASWAPEAGRGGGEAVGPVIILWGSYGHTVIVWRSYDDHLDWEMIIQG